MLRLIIKSVKHGESWRDFNSQADIDAFLEEKGDHFGVVAENTVEYIIQDVSDEYFKKDQKKVDKIARKLDLENIKWSEVTTIAELKRIVKHLVNEVID